jgi:capsular polysaccharide biosynthesis protein
MGCNLSEKLPVPTSVKIWFASWTRQAAEAGEQFFSLITLDEYCKAEKPQTYTLATAESVVLRMPEVHPEHFRERLRTGSWPLTIPSVQAIEITDAEVMGKCDLIFTESRCLHHGLYRWERDLPAEEMLGMLGINAKRKRVARYAKVKETAIVLDQAISLIGSASANYVHWLTETAPKLALIDEIDRLKAYPLIIDAGLHPNIIESLNCLNTHRREIVPLERGQLCKVGKLIAISPVAYVPFDYRRGFAPEQEGIDPGWAMFIPRGLHKLREKLLPRMESGGPVPGRRLYLRRTSQFRAMRNAAEVEALLRESGFQVIEPETLSFAEQIRLFSAAESIVAQAGAALGNIIFAPQGCRVVILSAWSPFSIYYYFSNLASIFGQKCTYALCEPASQEGNEHPAHKELKVDIQALKEAIDQ